MSLISGHAAQIYRRLFGAGLRRWFSPRLGKALFAFRAARWRRLLAKRTPLAGPVLVSGLMNRASGIGRAGRLTAATLEAAGHDVIRHDAEPTFALSPIERLPFPVQEQGGDWIIHLNAPEAAKLLSCFRLEDFADRRRIGFWAYELHPAPTSWGPITDFFHEIWAPSEFTAEALRAVAPTAKISVVPHPAPDVSGARPDRSRFGLPENAVLFFSLFDTLSSRSRKNPLGAIQAYTAAFPEPQNDVRLIIKAANAGPDSADLHSLSAVARRPDIVILTDVFSDEEMLRLLASIDVLVSLHRAEGFGLPLLEAMSLGKPVIATGWSGNMEFMTAENSVLVGYKLVPVQDAAQIYASNDRLWAEPDIQDAAHHIKRLSADAQARRILGENAQRSAAENRGRKALIREFASTRAGC